MPIPRHSVALSSVQLAGGGRVRRRDRAPRARGRRDAAGRDPGRPGSRAGQRRCDRRFLPELGPPRQRRGPGRAPGRGPARGGLFVGRPDLAEQGPGPVAGAAAVPVRQPGGLDVLGQDPQLHVEVPAAPAGGRAGRAGADGERGPDRGDDQRRRQRLSDGPGRARPPSVVARAAGLAFHRRAPGPPGHARGPGAGAVRAGARRAGQHNMALRSRAAAVPGNRQAQGKAPPDHGSRAQGRPGRQRILGRREQRQAGHLAASRRGRGIPGDRARCHHQGAHHRITACHRPRVDRDRPGRCHGRPRGRLRLPGRLRRRDR